jgi:cyclase
VILFTVGKRFAADSSGKDASTKNSSPSCNHSLSHSHKRDRTHPRETTRRNFLHVMMSGALAGASVLELAWHRAAWARAEETAAGPKLFDIEKVADGIYFAQARPQAEINCNASIFVRNRDVVVVDSHSKPSAASSLLRQIRSELTPKPVRYVINTHFHWDHTQGNQAYRVADHPIDFIASASTKQLMSDTAVARMKASVEQVPREIEKLRTESARATSPAEKAFCADQIHQLEAYRAELKDYSLELPTITFEKSYVLQDPAFELHIEFHGRAHTAGDVVVFCPQKRIVATGDVIHGFLPFIADGYPRTWPATIQSIGQLEFTTILPGHAAIQAGRGIMSSQRHYIEELTARVEEARKACITVPELQKRTTVASLRSLELNGYGRFIMGNYDRFTAHFDQVPPLQDGVNTNIEEIYSNLDRD